VLPVLIESVRVTGFAGEQRAALADLTPPVIVPAIGIFSFKPASVCEMISPTAKLHVPLAIGRTTYHGANRLVCSSISSYAFDSRSSAWPFLDDAQRELPLLFGLVEPLEKAFALLSNDSAEQLQDDRAVLDQKLLEDVECVEPPRQCCRACLVGEGGGGSS
jgi:hypothetical protein